jgi:hypothetical protein
MEEYYKLSKTILHDLLFGFIYKNKWNIDQNMLFDAYVTNNLKEKLIYEYTQTNDIIIKDFYESIDWFNYNVKTGLFSEYIKKKYRKYFIESHITKNLF